MEENKLGMLNSEIEKPSETNTDLRNTNNLPQDSTDLPYKYALAAKEKWFWRG